MRRVTALLLTFTLLAPGLAIGAPPAGGPASLIGAAETAAASGAWRAQNTPTVSTGLIREDDKKRSAIAYGLSGALAFLGAGLWHWVPCRGASASATAHLDVAKYVKCYDADGSRAPLEPPVKALLAGGVVLELVSLGYLIAHLRGGDDDAPAPAGDQP